MKKRKRRTREPVTPASPRPQISNPVESGAAESAALDAVKLALRSPRALTTEEGLDVLFGPERADGSRGPLRPINIVGSRRQTTKRGRPPDADRAGKRPKYSSAMQRALYRELILDPQKRAKAKDTRSRAGDPTRSVVAARVKTYQEAQHARSSWVRRLLAEPKLLQHSESTIRRALKALGF